MSILDCRSMLASTSIRWVVLVANLVARLESKTRLMLFGSRRLKHQLDLAREEMAHQWLLAELGDSLADPDAAGKILAAYLAKRSVEPQGWWAEAKLGNYWCLRYVAINYLLGTARSPDLKKSYFWLQCGAICADSGSYWPSTHTLVESESSRRTRESENEIWSVWEDRLRTTLATVSFKHWDKQSKAAHNWFEGLFDHIRRNHLPGPHERTAHWRTTTLTDDLIRYYAAHVPDP